MIKISELKKNRVKTTEGLVQGFTEDGLSVWKGIRYAAAPIADLRFQDPQKPQSYEGIYQATAFGNMASQKESIFNAQSAYIEESREDCLFLNIWSPAADDKKRAVMVWIHGGAYAVGAGSEDLFNGHSLASNGDVVVVNFNYRISGLGYMHFGVLAQELGIEGFSENLGLKDQVAALQWIKNNIEAFGGDPDNITIFGESAGAASVTTLLATPAAQGTFHKAIAQSSCVNAVVPRAKAKRYVLDTLKELNLEPKDLAELKGLAVEDILHATHAVVEKNLIKEPGSFIFSCVIGDFLPRHPIGAAKDKKLAVNVPLMIGTNSDESSVFGLGRVPLLPTRQNLQEQLFERVAPLHRDKIASTYENYPKKSALYDLATDWAFRMPTIWFAENYASKNPVWVYEFQYASPFLRMSGFGAAHSSEIPYIFHNYDSMQAKVISALSSRSAIDCMGKKMQDTWLRFARNGDPNLPEAYAVLAGEVLEMDESHERIKGQSNSEAITKKQLGGEDTVIGQSLVSSILNFNWPGAKEEATDEGKAERNFWPSMPRYEELAIPSFENALSYARNSFQNLNLQESLHNISLATVKNKLGVTDSAEEEIHEEGTWVPWPIYTPQRRAVRVINMEDRIAVDPGKESRLAWNTVLHTIFKRSENNKIRYR